MKIAKILLGSPVNQKGFFNNVIERAKHLMEVEPNVDCYMLRLEHGLVLRLLKRQFKKTQREEFSTVDGLKFKNIWLTMGLFDYLISYRFHMKLVVGKNQLNKYANLFEKYDLLSPHGPEAIFLAACVKEKFKIPFVSTWHGSDINIIPFHNDRIRNQVRLLLNSASHNFFVSRKLLETSDSVSKEAIKSVLYTGPSKVFYQYSNVKKIETLRKYNIKSSCVVGFIGNFVPIKNVFTLPLIFKKIQDKHKHKDISFVVVGDGLLEHKLLSKFAELDIKNIHILGKQDPINIPDIMNCLNVLVLPSLNEGMPRVTLEAQACGVHVVGSSRGGIPEAIGKDNCFDLDADFIDNITFRISELFNGETKKPVLPEKFSWVIAIDKELAVYRDVLLNNSKI